MKIVLNEVDLVIKSMMLTYPSIMPSRFAALRQIFLTGGNGMEWENGRLVNIFKRERMDTVMDNSDLEERIKKNEEDLAKSPDRVFYEKYRLMYEREMMIRKHIEANIDIYATEHVMNDDDKHGVEWLKHINPDSIPLRLERDYGASFPDEMHPDWAEAAEETVRIAIRSLWIELGFPYLDKGEELDRSKANPVLLKKYEGFKAILEALDKFTHWKEREREHCKLVDEVMREIRIEEAKKKGA